MHQHHPYENIEDSADWQTLHQAIGNLVANGDLIENTPRQYTVGYLAHALQQRRQADTDQTK